MMREGSKHYLASNSGFLEVSNQVSWFGCGFINCLASDTLFFPFHKKIINRVKLSLVFLPNIIISHLILSSTVIEQFYPSIRVEKLL